MNHRIAPPGDMPTHGLAISYLSQLSSELTLLNAGEGTGVLLELTREWSTWRDDLNRCSALSRLSVHDMRPELRAHLSPHGHIVTFVDALIRDIETLWGWPPAQDFHIDPERIEQLRAYRRELEDCRERVEVKY